MSGSERWTLAMGSMISTSGTHDKTILHQMHRTQIRCIFYFKNKEYRHEKEQHSERHGHDAGPVAVPDDLLRQYPSGQGRW